ncbi:MAG: 3-methyl-2-oxobutanoate hydroxymethyltransferase [Cyanobacteria bacterium HKST-UBA04]|nr:3-methyl-2-oxobutanoate hydroxymethyltransferase [Cyanobacteria bacterium HKST-UBA04]MCA9841808.1 3-methyl-2-oxobutanoate hydroxymethyltransferase [Cyanobacteria bacterium HKST-UBA03]
MTARFHVSVVDLLKKKQAGTPIVMLTAYDYSMGKLIDQVEAVDVILVGDSLGMVCLGHNDTIHVTLDDMLHHVKAVRRGVNRAMLLADMPFMSMQIDHATAVTNATRMMQEGGADAIKIEGASPLLLEVTAHLVQSGIPVMGHLGFTPQCLQTMGGFKVQGKTLESAQLLIDSALKLQDAGVFGIILEMVPSEVAQLIRDTLRIPTIGIGAGLGCDGQVLVTYDLIGQFPDFLPRFARRYANVGVTIQKAVTDFAQDVATQRFPKEPDESFHFDKAQLPALTQYVHRRQAQRAEDGMESDLYADAQLYTPPVESTVSST